MYRDSSLVVIGESSFKIGLYLIHYDLQHYIQVKGYKYKDTNEKNPLNEAFSFPFKYHYVMCHNV